MRACLAALAWLPRTGRSFGPVGFALIALALIRWMLVPACLYGAAVYLGPHWAGLLAVTGNLIITGCVIYGLWIEPLRLGVTRIEIGSPKLNGLPPVRVLHLSDLHIERITRRGRAMESGISADYLRLLDRYYDEWLTKQLGNDKLPTSPEQRHKLLMEKRMQAYQQLCDIVYQEKGFTSDAIPKREVVEKFGLMDEKASRLLKEFGV
jgi:hypothetical protein